MFIRCHQHILELIMIGSCNNLWGSWKSPRWIWRPISLRTDQGVLVNQNLLFCRWIHSSSYYPFKLDLSKHAKELRNGASTDGVTVIVSLSWTTVPDRVNIWLEVKSDAIVRSSGVRIGDGYQSPVSQRVKRNRLPLHYRFLFCYHLLLNSPNLCVNLKADGALLVCSDTSALLEGAIGTVKLTFLR